MKRLVWVAVGMPAAALPLILVFFVIMPRPQFPLWDYLAPSEEKRTGLSEKIEPGATSQVQAVRSVVLRAQSPRLDRKDLYWRGIVLNSPRNNAWVRLPASESDFSGKHDGQMIQQSIFLEPNSGSYLVSLDTPIKISGVPAVQSSDLVFTRRSKAGRVRYDTASSLGGRISVHGTIDRNFYLALPDRLSSRVKALGKKIASQGRTDNEKLAVLEEFFSSANYRYATAGLPRSEDPVGEFLFENKAGHCELFATSFMILLREAGVPARLVGGYYGGDYNDFAGYYLVTEDMAHVWVEVYLEGAGWVRKDPSVFAVNFSADRDRTSDSLFATLQKISDSFNYYWNVAVVTYDLDKQMHLFMVADSTMRSFSFSRNSWWLVLVIIGFGGILSGVWFFVRRPNATPEKKLVQAFYALLAKKYPDISVTTDTGLMELALVTCDTNAMDFAEIIYSSTFRDRRLSPSQILRLREILDAMKNSRKKDENAGAKRHNSLT